MQPRELTRDSFKTYPPLARELACAQLSLLRELPLALVAILLRDEIDLDSCFPPEKKSIEDRFTFLASLPADARNRLTEGFASLSLPDQLSAQDWVRFPRKFEEDLSAFLWSSHQLDKFREISEQFVDALHKAVPAQQPPTPRWAAVILSAGLHKDGYPLFRKLRDHGVFFPSVTGEDGTGVILRHLAGRGSAAPVPYGHWYIEGASLAPVQSSGINRFSWNESTKLRAEVLRKVQSVIGSGAGGPEMLRTVMAGWTSQDESAGASDTLIDSLVQRIYDEGSGTQIFSTTFVQWSAREVLRRAQPVSLVARFGPRQRQRSLNDMFARQSEEMDAQGSLVDGDFGAYYTWINLNRLTGSQNTSFIAWSESHHQAVAIGPGLPRGTQAPDPVSIERLLKLVAST